MLTQPSSQPWEPAQAVRSGINHLIYTRHQTGLLIASCCARACGAHAGLQQGAGGYRRFRVPEEIQGILGCRVQDSLNPEAEMNPEAVMSPWSQRRQRALGREYRRPTAQTCTSPEMKLTRRRRARARCCSRFTNALRSFRCDPASQWSSVSSSCARGACHRGMPSRRCQRAGRSGWAAVSARQ